MDKILNMQFLKNLIKSRTIIGILVTAVGFLTQHGTELFSPEIVAQYGGVVKSIAAFLQVSGLGVAVYGRVNAEGPITDQVVPQSPSATDKA